MGGRINTVMQTCFFAVSGVLPRDEAIAAIKRSIVKTYGKRGDPIVQRNFAAVDRALDALYEVAVPATTVRGPDRRPAVPANAPDFVREVLAQIMRGEGDALPVSALPPDGAYPSGTARWEKRRIAAEIPVWDASLCIQCGKCVLVCPHAVIRAKVASTEAFAAASPALPSVPASWRDLEGLRYTLQISADDCTGCALCVEVCPAKSKSEVRHKALTMAPLPPARDEQSARWQAFLALPDIDRSRLNHSLVKDVQLFPPLFEFSGACAGCGETPYLKLLTQLFGDRAIVANATGCSSIYGGSLPATPWAAGSDGRGPAWANSLFEDNAEFGLGMRLAVDRQYEYARELVTRLAGRLGDLAAAVLNADQSSADGIAAQRTRVAALKTALAAVDHDDARELASVADALVKKSVWIVGGDGWAYDIGFGGLDHVLASGRDVNVLVLDTEVYSNTGGQTSKATPRGAVAKFSAGGKATSKKDLAAMAMTYGTVYVARVAMGANDTHTLRALREAEAFPGPSLVIAYSHCIAHGYDLRHGMDQQKAAVLSGHWPLLRYDPARAARGENPLQLDSRPPTLPLRHYAYAETRYTMLAHSDPDAAARLLTEAQEHIHTRWALYEHWAAMPARPAHGDKPA
jgi:pyruvate-ferredoxin/flavodoxin oxidoreductase